ncbi:tryptophan halogenase family protein [Sphingomonas canadensis]|uniref:Tryptophan halogenase family protein n=1 Tax=Sphingomonas canadensis TaxID=1219257 RepID=A0ABW3HC73_9SPHN|nr:tryptophan halogenase family protein [Sphingomonas canadensis]MCW3837701.1 tryptophan 7-halogenase [Sphingomonas canadensis]
MTNRPVKRVVIAGGGTAGWLAAAALGRQLGALVEIVLIESEEIGTIGVGESTVPTTRTFHSIAGIDEREFVRDNQASFKLGISFENWARPGDRYFHSFGTLGRATWMADFQHFWLEAAAQGLESGIGEYCLEHQAGIAGRFTGGEDGPLNYAYHLDASRYARFLRRLSEAAGVKRVEGRIERVEQHGESGFVEALVLASGERIAGDLFLDCTGFRSLLLGGTMGVPFDDWSHWLPTDSALPAQTRSVGPAVPYTRAIAHDAGWQWRIPLQHRVGNGFVYASAFLKDEDRAREAFHTGLEGEILIEPRLIRFKAGARTRTWEKNVFALGLSGSFIEPLESTAIHLIQVAVTRLMQSFPFDGCHPAAIERYNRRTRGELENIRDFIILHYHQTEREDSEFWRYVRHMPIPDSLAERIALFAEGAEAWQGQDELFRVDSWVQVMLGQRLRPRSHNHVARMMPQGQLRAALDGLKANVGRTVAALPPHQQYLDALCAGD